MVEGFLASHWYCYYKFLDNFRMINTNSKIKLQWDSRRALVRELVQPLLDLKTSPYCPDIHKTSKGRVSALMNAYWGNILHTKQRVEADVWSAVGAKQSQDPKKKSWTIRQTITARNVMCTFGGLFRELSHQSKNLVTLLVTVICTSSVPMLYCVH